MSTETRTESHAVYPCSLCQHMTTQQTTDELSSLRGLLLCCSYVFKALQSEYPDIWEEYRVEPLLRSIETATDEGHPTPGSTGA